DGVDDALLVEGVRKRLTDLDVVERWFTGVESDKGDVRRCSLEEVDLTGVERLGALTADRLDRAIDLPAVEPGDLSLLVFDDLEVDVPHLRLPAPVVLEGAQLDVLPRSPAVHLVWAGAVDANVGLTDRTLGIRVLLDEFPVDQVVDVVGAGVFERRFGFLERRGALVGPRHLALVEPLSELG